MTTFPVSEFACSKFPGSVAIVGGGASGFFTAVTLAQKVPGLRITLFEASARPLQKVSISGGGRCNLTHGCFDPQQLSTHYPRGNKAILGLFARFQPRDTMAWFEERGLSLKTEADGRIFPASNRSESVINLLKQLAVNHQVNLKLSARVVSITHQAGQFHLETQGNAENPVEAFDACVLATGYSPPGWKLAESLGHPINKVVPSLFPFKTSSALLEGLQGVSLPFAKGTLTVKPANASSGQAGVTVAAQKTKAVKPASIKSEGALLITHTGVSGPLIYRLSAWGARELAERAYCGTLSIDCLPHNTHEDLLQAFSQLFQLQGTKHAVNIRFPELPNRLWRSALGAVGITPDCKGSAVSKRQQQALVQQIKQLTLDVTGKSPSKEEFVSCGGVQLKTVNFKRMESRLLPRLFFAGEILDIDGLTGGFNFQACWSAAWVISEALKADCQINA
jgi:predicted flavoprotein YhiN